MGISTYLFRGEKYLRGMPNKRVGRPSPFGFLNPGDRIKSRQSDDRHGEGAGGPGSGSAPLVPIPAFRRKWRETSCAVFKHTLCEWHIGSAPQWSLKSVYASYFPDDARQFSR